ncbi:putative cytoChrome c-556 [Roseibium sp. TrichSKD4]|uniref:c-type cytochrome n=1 Tax=Roseibium sp. TrichSKD4 TaxID=744980 RepID=UPI0001E562D1|nr:cytochrome c [Roseibium sp. TrichSKD4]EFO33011.1 putative cytoChrome c-556 [Roseibium sp. TrichSKD4]
MKNWSAPALICAALLITATTVVAHQGATGVVKKRMNQMGELKEAMKAVGQMLKSDDDLNADVIAATAQAVQDNAGHHLTSLFPDGSLKKPSEARPEIWKNWTEFQRFADQLKAAGERLGKTASGDRKDVAEAFKELGQSCKACHEKFRLKSN